MKTLMLCLAGGLGFAATAWPQGRVTFGNNMLGLRAPIYGPEPDFVHFGGDWANAKTGNTASGIPAGTQTYGGALLEGFQVSFWAAPGTVTDGHLLAQGIGSTALGTGSRAGFFPTTSVIFPGLLPAGTATVQVRVTDPSGVYWFGGNQWPGYAAVSALFTVDVTTLGSTATGLRSFSAGWLDPATLAPYVPEPASASMVLLGLGILMSFRPARENN